MKPIVTAFFDQPSFTYSYVVHDPVSSECAIIDSVLDFDYAAGKTSTEQADLILAFVEDNALSVRWILETHVHADHLSAAPYLQRKTGAKVGIGAQVSQVQNAFSDAFNVEPGFCQQGSQFDCLFEDGECIALGAIEGRALHTPGHTPACLSYQFVDAVFVGDTLFMPDYGTARCDFPGGDARALYRSIHTLFAMPEQTRLFMCHDYKAPGRDDFAYETTVGEQKAHNVHIAMGVSEDDFVDMRTRRDSALSMPKLILPAVQINMRAGQLPPAEDNGQRYLKIPIDLF